MFTQESRKYSFFLAIFSFKLYNLFIDSIGGDMKERVISAILMFIILVPLLYLGSWPFNLLILVLGLLATYELLNLNKNLPKLIKFITYISVILIIIINTNNKNFLFNLDSKFLIVLLFIYLSMLVFINNQSKYNYKDAFYLVGIVLFLGISFSNFIIIRNKDLYLLIYLLSITITTDTFALFIGKAFGKHKLASKISPNKTIEGFVGGSLIGTIIASLIYIIFILKEYQSVYLVILITFILTLIGQLGDLIKSSIKRNAEIKDFSNLIPGHGGILDRCDSIIFVIMSYIIISNLF